jgi:hypothetical protein
MDMRFGTWNIRSLYRIGTLKTVARDFGKYKLDLVGVEEVRCALGGLVVSVLATEPTGYSVAGSSPTEDGGFLRVIKTLHSMSEMLCRPNFLTCFSPASPASLPDGSGC